MCCLLTLWAGAGGGGHLPCHLLLWTQMLSFQRDIFKSSSEGTRARWSPVVSASVERSPEIRGIIFSLRRHPRLQRRGSLRSCWFFFFLLLLLFFFFVMPIFTSATPRCCSGGHNGTACVRVILSVHFCDKWGVCSFVSSAGRSTNRVQVGLRENNCISFPPRFFCCCCCCCDP